MHVKIEYNGDCYMLVVQDIPSLADLRRLAHAKIAQDYDATGRTLNLSLDHRMRLKYLDGQDHIVLIDEGDLAVAVEIHTNELKVYISELK